MSKHRYIDTKLWSDNWVVNLDPIEKLLFVYLLTNEKTNICMIYELPIKTMAYETGIEKDMVEKIIQRFTREGKVSYYNGWIRLVNAIKHQNVANPQIKKGIVDLVMSIPQEIRQKLGVIDDSYMTHTCLPNNRDRDRDRDLINTPPTPPQAGGTHTPEDTSTIITKRGNRKDWDINPWSDQDSKNYILEHLNGNDLATKLIGKYFTIKKVSWPNYKTAAAAFTRELKMAKILAAYPEKDVDGVFAWCVNNAKEVGYDWKLETAYKNIDGYRAAVAEHNKSQN